MASKSTKNAAVRRSTRKSTGPSLADVVRLGLNAATIKSQVPTSQWKQAVGAAHKQGYTVASALDPSIPAELKARLKSSISAQANSQVNAAYAPQEKALSDAENQAHGLALKRTQDEDRFNQWYAQKVSESNAAIQAAQQRYEDYMKASGPSPEQAQQAADQARQTAQQGQSSDLSNSTYLKMNDAVQQNRADDAKRAAATAIESGATTAARMQGNTASIAGRHDQSIAGINSDLGKTISEVTQGRVQLTAAKAGDIIKTYSDLVGQEATKANAVQQNAIARDTLSQKASQAQQQNDQFYAGLKTRDKISQRSAATSKANNKRTTSTAITVAGINATQKQLDRDLKAQEGKRNRANALRVAAVRHAKNPDGTPSDAAIKSSVAQVGVIHTISDIVKKYGPKFRDANGHVVDTRTALISRGYSGAQIDAGAMLARQGHINDQLARQLGILPQQRG